jgi:2-polyprenyl-3-methyl-5-hydroxy-6-metoxy-1,4-benzoquinol methylase
MSSDREQLETFWRDKYESLPLAGDGQVATWLDYSSDRVRGQRLQSQTHALVIEAIGDVQGKRLLDVGCGWGKLTRATAALGAHAVGLDILASAIAKLKADQPSVDWVAGNFLDPVVQSSLGRFDRVVVVETFQCAGLPELSLRAVWPMVAPGGRLVAIMPNAACPIVQRAVAAHPGTYYAMSVPELIDAIRVLPDLDRFAMRGLSFAADQWIAPYEVSAWAENASAWPTANRVMICCTRRE